MRIRDPMLLVWLMSFTRVVLCDTFGKYLDVNKF